MGNQDVNKAFKIIVEGSNNTECQNASDNTNSSGNACDKETHKMEKIINTIQITPKKVSRHFPR